MEIAVGGFYSANGNDLGYDDPLVLLKVKQILEYPGSTRVAFRRVDQPWWYRIATDRHNRRVNNCALNAFTRAVRGAPTSVKTLEIEE